MFEKLLAHRGRLFFYMVAAVIISAVSIFNLTAGPTVRSANATEGVPANCVPLPPSLGITGGVLLEGKGMKSTSWWVSCSNAFGTASCQGSTLSRDALDAFTCAAGNTKWPSIVQVYFGGSTMAYCVLTTSIHPD